MRFRPGNALILSLSILCGATALHAQHDYYLPQISNGNFAGGSLRTTFVLLNHSDSSASIVMTLTGDDGGPLRVTIPELGTAEEFRFTVEPGGMRMLQTDGSGPLVAGAARVSSTAPIGVVAIFSTFDAAGSFRAEAGMGSSSPVSEAIIPVDATGTVNTSVALFNYGSTTASITLKLLDTAGLQVGSNSLTLGARNHLSKLVAGELFAGVSNFRGTLVVSSTVPISAVAMRQNSSPFSLTALPDVSRSSAKFKFNLSQVTDGSAGAESHKTSFLLVNVSKTRATVTLALTKDDGSPFSVTIPGQGTGSTFTLNLEAGASAFLQTDGKGALSSGAARVISTAPLGVSAIDSVFDTAGRLVTESGIAESNAERFFNLPVEMTGGLDSGVALFNPSKEPVNLSFKLVDAQGVTVRTIDLGSLAGGQHTTRFVSEFFASGRRRAVHSLATTTNFRGSMVVTAASPGSGTVAALALRRNSAALSFTTLPVAPRFEPNPVDISLTLDGSRSATADIPVTGGTLSLTDAKGNKFTLTIPDKALGSPEKITMTAVGAATGVPLSGGLVAGVQLEPEGLLLFQLATLTMEPATAIAPIDETPIAWRSLGEGLHLYPLQLGTRDIVFKIYHFSGYGIGSGTSAQATAVTLQQVKFSEDAVTSRLGHEMLQERRNVLLGGDSNPNLPTDIENAQDEYYSSVIEPLMRLALATRDSDLIRCAVQKAHAFERMRQLVTGTGSGSDSISAAIHNFFIQAFEILEKNAVDRCRNQHDVSQVRVVVSLARQAVLFGVEPPDVEADIEKCLTFELDFTSEMEGTNPALGFSSRVHARLPVKLKPFPAIGEILGTGPVEYTKFTMTTAFPSCSVQTQASGSTFIVHAIEDGAISGITFNVNVKQNPKAFGSEICQSQETEATDVRVTLIIEPGMMTESAKLICEGAPPADLPIPGDGGAWRGGWVAFHGSLGDNASVGPDQWVIKDWDVNPGGELFARKVFTRSKDVGGGAEFPITYIERTTLDLFHRPQ